MWLSATIVGTVVSLYTTFVAMCYWNWFLVRAINVNQINYFEMLGVVWLIGIFTSKHDENEYRWKILFSCIDACVPRENVEMLKETIKSHNENIWWNALFGSIGILFGNSFTLALGYVLHRYLNS